MWQHLGTHIGSKRGSSTPHNIDDGFYYIPLLESITKLMENDAMLQQVYSIKV